MTHTNSKGVNAWWKVTFNTLVYVDVIKIWNRMDCCQHRIDSARVLVDSKEVGTVTYSSGKNPYEFTSVDAIGSEVKIVGGVKTSILSIAEVEIFGAGQYNYIR